MKIFLNLSIKNKLILIIVVVTTFTMGAGFTLAIFYDIDTYKEEMISNTRINAQLISEYCVAPLTFRDHKEATSIIEKIKTLPSITNACVYDENGKLFASFQKVEDKEYPASITNEVKDVFEKDNFKVYYPIVYQGFKYGTIYLKASTDLLRAKIRRHLVVKISLMLGLLILSYFIALKLQSAISKPILNLTHATNKITREADYSLRVQKQGYDEIGLLYDSFNEMLTQLNSREEERNMAMNLLYKSEAEIRKLNQELEQRVTSRTAQLVAANKELENFAYSVAHDLRSPLRGIDGFCQILLDDYQNKLDKQGKDYLRRVRSAAQRMAQLIDDLLKLSNMTRSEMNIRQVNLSEMALEIADNLLGDKPERLVKFIIQEEIKARGDGRLLHTVLENLIGNAWKFTSKNPTACIEFGKQLQNERTVYFVHDDGAGFDMKYAKKLFGAFQRLHTVNEFPGTGIGLATVQLIIQRHGGNVWAEGEVEKGATFYFTIP